MRVAIIVLAVAAVALGSTASADPYKDFTAQGYRWVAVDGPYACPSKADLQEITSHRTDLLEVKMVSDVRSKILSEWWKRPQHQLWCFKGKRCPAQPRKLMLML